MTRACIPGLWKGSTKRWYNALLAVSSENQTFKLERTGSMPTYRPSRRRTGPSRATVSWTWRRCTDGLGRVRRLNWPEAAARRQTTRRAPSHVATLLKPLASGPVVDEVLNGQIGGEGTAAGEEG